MYCPGCKKHTTWMPIVPQELETRANAEAVMAANISRSGGDRPNWLKQFVLRIVCARTTAHDADFYFEVVGPNAREGIKYAMGEKVPIPV